jgi:hypothetical protein
MSCILRLSGTDFDYSKAIMKKGFGVVAGTAVWIAKLFLVLPY